MRERKELIEPAAPRRRAVLLTDAPEQLEVVIPEMGHKAWADKLPEEVFADVSAAIERVQAGVQVPLFKDEPSDAALTDWNLGDCPPCTGWWDYRVTHTSEEGRLWFKAGAVDGLWYQTPESERPINRHSTVSGTMAWRGLRAPWPDGYPYPVPAPGVTKAPARRRAE